MKPPIQDWSRDLNTEQYQAVTHGSGPLLVFAGAGSGKTRVITHRIAHLIREQGVAPRHILALTFTNNAADEMRRRVSQMLASPDLEVTVRTFHSFCTWLLRREARRLGYNPAFSIYDDQDTGLLIARIMREMEIKTKHFTPREIAGLFSLEKIWAITGDERAGSYIGDERHPFMVRLFNTCNSRMHAANALDFTDLIVRALQVLREFPSVLQQYCRRFTHILVDEFQDTDNAQFQLLQLLAGESCNLTVVGDDDQSIYVWRGADPRNILQFESQFSGTRIVTLDRNYRSTQEILDAASAIASNNLKRRPKKLWTKRRQGEKVAFCQAHNDRAEAAYIVREIERLRRQTHCHYQDIAVFYRTNVLARTVEDAFKHNGIPYRLVGSVKFYERQEVKDILAYLRVLVNPDDAESFIRAFNRPLRGLGTTAERMIRARAKAAGCDLLTALRLLVEEETAPGRYQKSLTEIHRIFTTLRDRMAVSNLEKIVTFTMEHSGYLNWLEEKKDAESQRRIQNLQELVSAAQAFEEDHPGATLRQFLDTTALVQDTDDLDPSQGTVSLMTIHLAKGLEFPFVFIIGLEESIFPHSRSVQESGGDLEEERRLLYVGMTRAIDRLHLLCCRSRFLYGREVNNAPSLFLREIPADMLAFYTEKAPGQGPWSDDFRNARRKAQPSRRNPILTEDSTKPYDKGMIVYHHRFGKGMVRSSVVTPMGHKVEIIFDRGGKRVLIAELANLKRMH